MALRYLYFRVYPNSKRKTLHDPAVSRRNGAPEGLPLTCRRGSSGEWTHLFCSCCLVQCALVPVKGGFRLPGRGASVSTGERLSGLVACNKMQYLPALPVLMSASRPLSPLLLRELTYHLHVAGESPVSKPTPSSRPLHLRAPATRSSTAMRAPSSS